jgi:NADH-quinone oxidoreductase subunit A
MNAVLIWPVIAYFALVLVVVGAMLGISLLLGERHRERVTDEPYESGIPPTGTARLRFDVKFYLIAMFFVIFDLETAFLFGWAIAVRELSWSGYAEAVIFVAILLVALLYLWRVGALDWGPRRRRPRSTLRGEK